VTLKDVKELSNPGAPLKDQHFIASTNIESWNAGSADTRVPNGESELHLSVIVVSVLTFLSAFRTDSDITKTNALRRDRELQAWQPTPDPIVPQSDEPPAPLPQLGQGDDVTFGPGAKNTQWDQFAVNEKLFGVKTNFDEDVYTTRLDRSAADFKERERKAQKIANEITGVRSYIPFATQVNSARQVVTNNPHVAEERTVNIVDDSGMDEEDKYVFVCHTV
jgi:PAB1-binding protein PBP1